MKKLAIFGLGNPGEKYSQTRHNVGFLVLNSMANEQNWKTNAKLETEICETVLNETKLILAKPTTFMNNSGQAVSKVMNYYNISKENILIIQDDLDIPFGSIRFSKDSGPAGHNGIKSIIQHLGTKDFVRLRIGISNEFHKEKGVPSEKFVLENFNAQEKATLENNLLQEISKAVNFYIQNGLEKTKTKHPPF